MEHLHTTICALATPPGEGGIATVRVSGPDAYGIVGKIFVPVRQGKSVADAKGYTAMLGHYLLHGAEMDECVALFFRAPHSYTGEDVIELSVHGGTAMADGLLEALITAGCAPAGPGEAQLHDGILRLKRGIGPEGPRRRADSLQLRGGIGPEGVLHPV